MWQIPNIKVDLEAYIGGALEKKLKYGADALGKSPQEVQKGLEMHVL